MPRLLIVLVMALLVGAGRLAGAGAVIREPGAIYLEDLMEKPVRIATIESAPIFYQSDMARYRGT